MNNFNYNKTYYKVTNTDEVHNGYKYKDGLNVLNDEFNDNPKYSCIKGRLYFTDYENLPRYFSYGVFIREVKIPKNAKVILDSKGWKWGTDRLIFGKRYRIIEDFDKWFDPERFNWKYSYLLAVYCSVHFEKWFNPDKFNWKYIKNLICYCGDYFDIWFDKDKVDCNKYSDLLAKYCSKHFDKWFDKNLYDYDFVHCLAEHCSEHFEKWFIPNKFNWVHLYLLERHCDTYRHIWEKYKS